MSLDERLAAYWADADDADPEGLRRGLDTLLHDLPADHPVAIFERASLHDFLGEENEAIPLYRAALGEGLGPDRRTSAVIQLASSLRNIGEPSAAIALLRQIDATDPLWASAQAFLALALLDDAKPAPAVRAALHALAPQLPAYRRSVQSYADLARSPEKVRNVAVALLVRDGHVLAEEYPATEDHDVFLRLPGGGLEFGETMEAAVRREIAEELGAELDVARPMLVTENLFTLGSKRGHEIVHVFAVRSAALEALPVGHRLPVLDSDTSVGWYPLAELRRSGPPLYPAGMLELAEREAVTVR